jgi:DNA-binding response OmpR family regulator
MTILVVDDEPGTAEILQAAFERRGHACLLASTIEEANWILSAASLDAIVIDFELGGANTLAWLQALAVLRPELARRTVILASRVLSGAESVRAAASGARVVLSPIGADELVDAVAANATDLVLHGNRSGGPARPAAWGGTERRRFRRGRSDA